MPLTLVPLPADRFDRWLQRSTREYIADLVATGHSEHQAETSAHQTMRKAFPEGKPTGSNSVFHVLDETLGVVGYLWIGRDMSEDPSSWWIWDVLIEEKFRGRGFGKATMLLAEEHARSQGGAPMFCVKLFSAPERHKVSHPESWQTRL